MALPNNTFKSFAPFKESTFRSLWIGSFVSNIGTWMQNIGVSWLAATMSSSSLLISLVQVASSLPSLFLSYPAGVISDHCNRKKLLIWLQVFLFLTLMVLSLLTQLHLLNITILIIFTFLVGAGSACSTPIWQAITPEVVSAENMKNAIAMNGVSFNLSRAIGPALGGIVLTLGGIQSIFLFNAISYLALVGGIYRWKNEPAAVVSNGFKTSFREGLHAVRDSGPFRQLIIRTLVFTAFVSVVFALLPHLSKYEWHQSGKQYTLLWVWLGIGALMGSVFYNFVTNRLRSFQIIAACCAALGICIFLLGTSTGSMLLSVVMFMTGVFWIWTTSTLNILAQLYSPQVFKGRFLAVNVTVFQGSIALFSVVWGYVSNVEGTLDIMKIAGVGMLAAGLILLFFPMTEPEAPLSGNIACSDPLLVVTGKIDPVNKAGRLTFSK